MLNEIPELQETFRKVCGFPIDRYDRNSLAIMIEVLETGEAETFREALIIMRTIKNHNQLMEENKRLENMVNENDMQYRKEMKKWREKQAVSKAKLTTLKAM